MENKSANTMPKLTTGGMGTGPQRFSNLERPANAKETFQRLLRIFKPWRRSLALATLFTLLSSGASLVVPLLIGRAINTFDPASGTVKESALGRILLLMMAAYGLTWVLETAGGLLINRITQNLIRRIRSDFFDKLERIPLSFFDQRSHGDTMSRMTNDVDNISSAVGQTTTQLIASLFMLTGSLVMMLYLSLPLTGLALVSVPLFLGLTRTITAKSRRHFQGQQRSLGELSGVLEENITGLKMVKAFHRQEGVLAQFQEVNAELYRHGTLAQIWVGFMMPFMGVISNLGFALVATAGGVLSLQGAITVGTVVSFLTYSKQFGRPLNNIAGMISGIQSALVGAERVFEILDEGEETPDSPKAEILAHPQGELRFEHVQFSYNGKTPVFTDFNLIIHPGEVVALVGETGAGKTTLVNLMTRFYEVDGGRILLDGKDITTLTRRSLLQAFSVVLQDAVLFSGTVADNIRYGKPEASQEEVIRAAQLAHAEDFILKLPQGYGTEILPSSDSFSQGQRQLLAIARAVLSEAPILILDEATSSVDTRTEKAIQKAMVSLLAKKTSLIIAHRLSTIKSADRILVLDQGMVQEEGTHGELMAKKERYYAMVMSQLGG